MTNEGTAPLKVSQEARERAFNILDMQPPITCEQLAAELQRAFDMGERRGLEGAAEVAENWHRTDELGEWYRGNDIARAIRSLGDGEGVG